MSTSLPEVSSQISLGTHWRSSFPAIEYKTSMIDSLGLEKYCDVSGCVPEALGLGG